MSPHDVWRSLNPKLIAILRGITPAETPAIVTVLLDEGFRAIEIPLNSPDPYTSIGLAVELAASRGACLTGAGTVLTASDVERVERAGGNLIVSPNIDPTVVAATLERGMASFPGVFTASEAHLAIRLGVTGLKFFPASRLGAAGIGAIGATIPEGVQLCAVGGVGPDEFADYRRAGVVGFGVGSNLYRAGDGAEEVRRRARAMLTRFDTG